MFLEVFLILAEGNEVVVVEDNITQLGVELVFIEVQTRINSLFGWPEEAVHYKKRKFLQGAAEVYLERSGDTPAAIRFDIIAITFTQGEQYELEHFEDAF